MLYWAYIKKHRKLYKLLKSYIYFELDNDSDSENYSDIESDSDDESVDISDSSENASRRQSRTQI
jgi:hypothetical protein